VVMRVSLKNPSRSSRTLESRISSALYGSCSCNLDLAADYLVRVSLLPLILTRVDQNFVAGLNHEHYVDPLVGVDQLVVRIDVDVGIAAVRVEIRQREHLRCNAEPRNTARLHGQQLAQFASRNSDCQ